MPFPLIFLTALFALFQIINAVTVLQLPTEITSRVSLPVQVNAGLSLVWASAFFLVTVSLLRHQPNAKRAVGWLITGFILYSGLRLLLFARADYDRARLPFLAGIIIVLLMLSGWRLWHSRPNSATTGEGKQDGDESTA